MNKVFRIYITCPIPYDAYDSHVVVAANEEEAKDILIKDLGWSRGSGIQDCWGDAKPSLDEVHVEELGPREGLVISSFNAG